MTPAIIHLRANTATPHFQQRREIPLHFALPPNITEAQLLPIRTDRNR